MTARDAATPPDVAQLAGALRRYADHLPECTAWAGRPQPIRTPRRPIDPEHCSCGLVAALERANLVPAP